MKLTEIRIHYKLKKSEDVAVKTLPVTGEWNPTHYKLEIAKSLEPMMKRLKYYYVVAVVKTGRKLSFRTVVPKVVIQA